MDANTNKNPNAASSAAGLPILPPAGVEAASPAARAAGRNSLRGTGGGMSIAKAAASNGKSKEEELLRSCGVGVVGVDLVPHGATVASSPPAGAKAPELSIDEVDSHPSPERRAQMGIGATVASSDESSSRQGGNHGGSDTSRAPRTFPSTRSATRRDHRPSDGPDGDGSPSQPPSDPVAVVATAVVAEEERVSNAEVEPVGIAEVVDNTCVCTINFRDRRVVLALFAFIVGLIALALGLTLGNGNPPQNSAPSTSSGLDMSLPNLTRPTALGVPSTSPNTVTSSQPVMAMSMAPTTAASTMMPTGIINSSIEPTFAPKKYELVSSGTCESSGLFTVPDAPSCAEAAAHIGHGSVTRYFVGFDVVDGCSLSSINVHDDFGVFFALPGNCQKNAYGRGNGCVCTEAVRCICSALRIPTPTRIPFPDDSPYVTVSNGTCESHGHNVITDESVCQEALSLMNYDVFSKYFADSDIVDGCSADRLGWSAMIVNAEGEGCSSSSQERDCSCGGRLQFCVCSRGLISWKPSVGDKAECSRNKLFASDSVAEDWFGTSVSTSGDTVVVGAWGDDSQRGAVYVYTNNGTAWMQQTKLTPSDGTSWARFGQSVSLDLFSGDALVASAYRDSGDTGAAYVYIRSGTTWVEKAKITPSDGVSGDYFGFHSVSMWDDTVVVGAYGSEDFKGAVYVYVQDGNSWVEQAKITASDGASGHRFGSGVAVHRDTIVVGADWSDDYKGAAYVYGRNGTEWMEQAKLTASDGAAWSYGSSVSMSDSIIVVGTTGVTAYVYTYNGISWVEQAKLGVTDMVIEDFWSKSKVSVSGNKIVVGYEVDDDGKEAAYVYSHNGTTWVEEAKIATTASSGDREFSGLSISGDTVVVGARYDDYNGEKSGSASVIQLCSKGSVSLTPAPSL